MENPEVNCYSCGASMELSSVFYHYNLNPCCSQACASTARDMEEMWEDDRNHEVDIYDGN